jgi:hypothetical protein
MSISLGKIFVKENMFGFLYILWGIVFVIFSGRAEGFVSYRSLPLFILFFVFLALFVDIIVIIYNFLLRYIIKSKTSVFKVKFFDLTAKIIAVLLFFVGMAIDMKHAGLTMETGDALVQAIEQYKVREGSYPTRLDVPEFAAYKPALRDSEFRIEIDNESHGSEFTLMFPSTAFMECRRKNTDSRWICDD